MRRGNLVTVALCLVTRNLRNAPNFRITVDPGPGNGLKSVSQIEIDKMVSVPRTRIGAVIGGLDDTTMLKVNHSLAVFTCIT